MSPCQSGTGEEWTRTPAEVDVDTSGHKCTVCSYVSRLEQASLSFLCSREQELQHPEQRARGTQVLAPILSPARGPAAGTCCLFLTGTWGPLQCRKEGQA